MVVTPQAREPGLAVEVRELRRLYRQLGSQTSVVALDGLSFSLTAGEIATIVGPTGCGKSTFFNITAGLERPTSGSVRVGGREPYREFDWFRGRIGVVFQ